MWSVWLRVWLDQDLQTLFSPLFSQGDVAFVGQKIISPIERATRVSSKIIRNTVKDHLTCEVWYCAYFCKKCVGPPDWDYASRAASPRSHRATPMCRARPGLGCQEACSSVSPALRSK